MPAFLDPQHLHGYLLTVARAGAWLALVAFIFVPLEYLFALHPKKIFRKGLAGDIGFYFIGSLIPGLILAVPLSLAAWVGYHLVPYRVHAAMAALPVWSQVVVALVVSEIGFYWGHRWCHQIPFLWRFHSVHHNPRHVYFIISSRAHPIDNAFIRLCGFVPAYVIGFANPLSPSGGTTAALVVVFLTLWGFVIHANVKWRLGPLEWIVATPRFHHWHHTRTDHRDRNYASTLPIMDVAFGTMYLPPKTWPAEYGISDSLPASVMGQLAYPFLPPPAETTAAAPIAAD